MRRTRSADERRFYEDEAQRRLERTPTGPPDRKPVLPRTLMSKDKRAMLDKGRQARPEDAVTPEEAIKDPYVLEFLNLKDEYSESQLEQALNHRLEDFLLELGGDFAFAGRQHTGESWFRVGLLFFHRRLRCLVIIDLKLTELTHANVGQMYMYCNYAKEH